MIEYTIFPVSYVSYPHFMCTYLSHTTLYFTTSCDEIDTVNLQ